MKREGYIYPRICSMDNIREAHKNARRDKSFYKEVRMIDENPTPYFEEIQQMLVKKTYYTSPYTIFQKHDSGKIRTIYKLPYYPDRIIHWAILLQTSHLFMRVFMPCSHAAIPGRGIHSAMRQVADYLTADPEGTKYCLKIDVHHFFPTIEHEILKQMLRKIIKCPDTLEMYDRIIDSMDGDIGVPIGNYPSQFLANFYLSYFDHWMKEVLHIKYYTRYMDDIVILAGSKEELWGYLILMRMYLWNELRLDIKDNYAVFPVASRSIDFTGYKDWGTAGGDRCKITLRKTTWKRMRRTLLDMQKQWDRDGYITERQFCQYNSYSGWSGWAVSGTIHRKYLDPLVPAMQSYRESMKAAKAAGQTTL